MSRCSTRNFEIRADGEPFLSKIGLDLKIAILWKTIAPPLQQDFLHELMLKKDYILQTKEFGSISNIKTSVKMHQ
jgi:hypothetical protein